MRFRFYWMLIPLLLLAIEGGVQAWRHVGVAPTQAPLFYWTGGSLQVSAPGRFGQALELYQADRGAEQVLELTAGRNMTVFYFEWDKLALGVFAGVGGHKAEQCNVEYGSFKLLESGGTRTYQCGNGESLSFDYTLLETPGGKPVHVYKLPWVQGYGKWVGTSGHDRGVRLKRSFLRHTGAARVLEAGISNAASENEAWGLFQREVLEKLEWR